MTATNSKIQLKQHNPFIRFTSFISTLCGVVSAIMIFSSVMITCQMIWVRFVLNQSTIWQTETVVYLMISATLLGLPYVQLVRGHVNVDLIPMMLPSKAQKVLSICTLILTILIVAIITFFGFEFFHIAYEKNWKSETVWGVSMWIPYLSLPLGFGLFLLQLMSDLYAVIIGQEEPFEHTTLDEEV